MVRTVTLTPYDPKWPETFESEAARVSAVFTGVDHIIEHVGSTSVPGLGAKPIVDMMLGAPSLADIEARIPAIEALGFEYVSKFEHELPERRYFRKSENGVRKFHLHSVATGGKFWRDHLAFRDYLRRHPESAEEYFRVKSELAVIHATAVHDYTEAKTPFIESILEKARAEEGRGS